MEDKRARKRGQGIRWAYSSGRGGVQEEYVGSPWKRLIILPKE